LGLSLLFLLPHADVRAVEEKGGYQVSVSKVTLNRNDARYGYYYAYRRVNRIQALKVVAKNTTFKEQPEAEVEWSLLVVKYHGGTSELLSGTEKLPALKAAQSTDLILGSAQIFGWMDASERTRDKLEWQVVIKRDGAEIMRSSSIKNFDQAARGAIRVKSEEPQAPPQPAAPGQPAAPAPQ
jgi:hypothetical protein